MLAGGEPKAKPKPGIILEQRIRPRRAPALMVFGPGRHRKVRTIDRRAAGGVGNLQAVAEQLRKQFQIRCLAAPRARPGEFEQRLEKLNTAYVGEIDAG